jgi:hypothetical protein
MLQLLRYPFKVWITSVLGGSALYILWIKYFEASHTVFNGIYLFTYIMTVVCSGLLSVRAFLFLWFAAHRLERLETPAIKYARNSTSDCSVTGRTSYKLLRSGNQVTLSIIT